MDRKSRAKTRFEAGFTLIEVVVALAILGMGLIIIIELFSGGLRLGRVSEEYTKAVNYGRMKMEEILVKPLIQEGVEEGEFDDTFRWQIGIKKVDVLPGEKSAEFKPPVEVYQVKVDILWKSGSKERSFRLESYKTMKTGSEEKKG